MPQKAQCDPGLKEHRAGLGSQHAEIRPILLKMLPAGCGASERRSEGFPWQAFQLSPFKHHLLGVGILIGLHAGKASSINLCRVARASRMSPISRSAENSNSTATKPRRRPSGPTLTNSVGRIKPRNRRAAAASTLAQPCRCKFIRATPRSGVRWSGNGGTPSFRAGCGIFGQTFPPTQHI